MDNDTTTNEEFEIFKKECLYWINEFCLHDWDVEFWHEDMSEAKARTDWTCEGKLARITFSKDWSHVHKTDVAIKASAFHEATELLLAELSAISNCVVVDHKRTDRAVHSVIHRLQHMLIDRERDEIQIDIVQSLKTEEV